MPQHLKGYQKSITLIKTGRLNKKQHKKWNINRPTSEKKERDRRRN